MRRARVITWRQRIRAALTQRLALKGTAVFLALVLWVITSTREETEELVPVRFAPTLEEGLVLAEDPPTVRVLVRGLGREVLELRQTPPVIRRPIGGDVPDTLHLELRAADVDLPPGVDARVLDVRPRRVTLAFQSVVQRWVPVRSALVVPPDAAGRVAAAFFFQPERVRIVGARRGVARTAWVRTFPDTMPARTGATRTVALDTAPLRALGVRVRPATVRVRIERLATARSDDGDAALDLPTLPEPPGGRATPPRGTPPLTAADSAAAPVRPDSIRRDSAARGDTSTRSPRGTP